MSGGPDKDARSNAGYRKPPEAHQFKKGASGNPKGRPKKKRAFKSDEPDALIDLFLDEAERKVTLNEGGKPTELAAMRAVVRSSFFSAIKGDRHAREKLLQVVPKLISDRDTEFLEGLEIALRYRATWLPVYVDCEKRRTEVPPLLPHPRDVIIDIRAQTIRLVGPCSTIEHAKYDRIRKHRDEIGNLVVMLQNIINEGLLELPNMHEDAARYEKLFEEIEEAMPPSLRWLNGRPPHVASYFVI